MNREERIKRMFYGWDEEKDIIREIQKCQRNWDLTKQHIHQEIIYYLLNFILFIINYNIKLIY